MDTPRIVSLPLPRMVSRTSSRLRMGGSGEGEDGGEGICEGKRMCERSLRVDCEVVRRRSSTGRRCKDHRPWPRPRSGVQFSLFAALLVLSVCALQLVAAQSTGTGTRTSAGGSAIASASTSASAVDATSTVATLTDSTLTRTQLDVGSSVGATFHLDTTSDEPVYISISLCSGPEIPAYDASNKNLQLSMGMSSAELRRATLFRLYVSDDPLNMSPGPDNLPDEKANVVYAIGGWAGVTLDQAPLGAWIAVWPPEDVRGVSGTYEVQVGASSTGEFGKQRVGLRPPRYRR